MDRVYEQRIADFVVGQWVDTGPQPLNALQWRGRERGTPTVEQLAQAWIDLAEFRALQLADWLETPEGKTLARVVEYSLPPLYQQDVRLVVAALRLAAEMQRAKRRQAGAVALAAVLALAAIVAFGLARSD